MMVGAGDFGLQFTFRRAPYSADDAYLYLSRWDPLTQSYSADVSPTWLAGIGKKLSELRNTPLIVKNMQAGRIRIRITNSATDKSDVLFEVHTTGQATACTANADACPASRSTGCSVIGGVGVCTCRDGYNGETCELYNGQPSCTLPDQATTGLVAIGDDGLTCGNTPGIYYIYYMCTCVCHVEEYKNILY